ncbi:hypothetical protein CMO89_03540 [Candidatus Woesearchaeota archaeon]|nr:hypothetical protein [Candidatus Woesearchaeota archaeon]|tara:strand:+ start:3326 stop:3517 length:192 start_codon:yes stop_codon:yes gene_type:complete
MDFGAITFRKSHVKEDIQTKIWEERLSFKRDLNAKVRDYCSMRMSNNLTLENLDKYWRKALKP